ncbi:stage II sporulation protein M [archaeon]|nr:stage II sporulation protein M [archaeon]MDD2477837.1 stage II sporulation protein M [Candidatus ainarchaeum sp.]MDD3085219.1 stage II sporulation protein M [Candidatus ainarchaeum sp.]MDD4221497.1 stage II sporulation protein M [Candidatus ainarchaeum sp.]MDD4662704.1 stage II sporulation protein M [Candidatus ainarchaeum sp.]
MVLELITNIYKLRQKPILMFFEAIILTLFSVFFSLLIFSGESVSFSILAFITIGALPLFNRLYAFDSYLTGYNKSFFKRHKKIILLLFYFFLGIIFAFVVIYFFSPATVKDSLFSVQFKELDKISSVRSGITGDVVSGSEFSQFGLAFKTILFNNLIVILSATLLSFFYGAGGLFLIAWNASILAAAIIKDVIFSFSTVNSSLFFAPFVGVFRSIVNFIGFIPHGFFEVAAYFIVSLAGAIFARDLFRGVFTTDFKSLVVKDFLYLFLLAIIFILIGALIEASYFL